MSGNFFEFEIDLPEGAELLENDLIRAKDDNDIDAVNEETFGCCDQDWDFDQARDVLDLDGVNEKDDCEDLEKSLSLLVDDDLADPAILDARTKAKPIQHKAQDLDELFGPASPPSLLDTDELVSPDHHNIWRPPNRNSPARQHPLLSDQSQAHKPFDDPSIITAGKTIPIGFLDHAAMTPHHNSAFPTPPHIGRPRPYTLEEVERQIKNESPQNESNGHSAHVQPTNQRPLPPQYRTPIAAPGVSLYGRASPTGVVMPHLGQAPVGTPARGVIQRPPQPRMYQTPPPMYNMSSGHHVLRMSSPVPPRHMGSGDGLWSPNPNHALLTPRGQRLPPRVPYTDPGQGRHRPDMAQMDVAGPYNNYTGGDYERRNQYHDPRDQRFINQSAFMFTPRDHHSFTREASSRMNYSQMTPSQMARDRYDDVMENPDSLMTQREKDWVIKIQMLQLQTDNPYIDDYYYMQYKMKQLALERKKQKIGIQPNMNSDNDTPKLLLPQLSHFEVRSYIPAQFEGVLGRLTASSVHNPRPVIDCKINVTHSDEGNLKGTKYKQVLVFIEKLYDILLDVDDVEKRMLASSEDTHPKLLEERRHKLDGFYLSLDCDTADSLKFNSVMCIRKGKQLINRLLPLLTQEQGFKIVDNMLKQLPILIRKDVVDEMLPSLYGGVDVILRTVSLPDLIHLSRSLQTAAVPTTQTNPLLTALQNKFGLSVVCSMLQRCESIHTNDPLDIDNQDRDKWSEFLADLVEKLTVANDRSLPLPKPLAKYENLTQHLERSLDRKVVMSVEEILKTWS